MDTGKRDDYTYYDGYEGELEFILSSGDGSIHIWDGYINDIFGNPSIDGKGWKGLTRDYNEMRGPFAEENVSCLIDVKVYLEDAEKQRGKTMTFEESSKVLEVLISWLNDHKTTEVLASVN